MQDFTAFWDRGDFTVSPVGAMCAPVNFRLDDGRTIQPFAVAPWSGNPDNDPRYDELPPLLKRLRGDWICVPFGMPAKRTDLSANWCAGTSEDPDLGAFFHGPSANLPFKLTRCEFGFLEFTLHYPSEHPIAAVHRSIRGVPGRAMLEYGLRVTARRTTSLPVGIHPVFRLPDAVRTAELQIKGKAMRVYTYPVDAEPGVSRLQHGAVFKSLSLARDKEGKSMDLSKHPLGVTTEEVVLVGHVDGHAALIHDRERYRVDLNWDRNAFPSCNLWISNCGRTAYPWNGRHRALGIEPVAAPWDLGAAVANGVRTPLKTAGVPTAMDFIAGETWSTSYTIEVSSL